MIELTSTQNKAIRLLKKRGFYLAASNLQTNWQKGRRWYVDRRVYLPTSIKKLIETGNKQVKTRKLVTR